MYNLGEFETSDWPSKRGKVCAFIVAALQGTTVLLDVS